MLLSKGGSMSFPEKSDPHSHKPKPGPGRAGAGSEETEMLKNDPAESAVSAVGMDEIAESGDRDPLLGSAVNGGDGDEASRARQAGEGIG
jgi:hypothetical protein